MEEYWSKLSERNPSLQNAETIVISIPSFRREVAKAFLAGAKSTTGRSLEPKDRKELLEDLDRLRRDTKKATQSESVFDLDNIFGGMSL